MTGSTLRRRRTTSGPPFWPSGSRFLPPLGVSRAPRCGRLPPAMDTKTSDTNKGTKRLELSDEEWKKRLSPEEYKVLRGHGTERPWTGCFVATKDPGTYVCSGCGNPLFESGTKFESGTGWP